MCHFAAYGKDWCESRWEIRPKYGSTWRRAESNMIFFPIRKCLPEVGKISNVSNDIDYYSCDNIGYCCHIVWLSFARSIRFPKWKNIFLDWKKAHLIGKSTSVFGKVISTSIKSRDISSSLSQEILYWFSLDRNQLHAWLHSRNCQKPQA